MKRKVFLLLGFNNWGKTTILRELIGVKQFRKDKVHRLRSAPPISEKFMIMPYSNDDFRGARYISELDTRLNILKKAKISFVHIISAFCPTKEPNNYSADLIKQLFPNDEVIMFGIKYKWCANALLNMDEIKNYYDSEGLKSIKYDVIDTDIVKDKSIELQALIQKYL